MRTHPDSDPASGHSPALNPSSAFDLDPRAKLWLLLLANAMLFCHVRSVTQAVMVALFLVPPLMAGRWRMALRFAALYAALTTVGAFAPASPGRPVATFAAMLATGVAMMLPCFITGAYAFATTSPGAFVCAMRRLRVPEAVVIPCVVLIRFFPTVREDYRHIRDAMALRGIAPGGLALLRRPARSLECILMPLLMNATTVAQDLSVAALTKGLGRPGAHTSRVEIRMRAVDWAVMAVCTAPLVLDVTGMLR